MADDGADEGFTWWYRFRTVLVLNLLYVAGPATLENSRNPRVQLEREYRRRQAVHRAKKHGGPVEVPEWQPSDQPGLDPFVLMVVVGALGLAVLVVWMLVAARG